MIVFTFAAGTVPLLADMACIGDCVQPASRLSGISGVEDIEAGVGDFDIFFKPGVPIFMVAPSDLADELSSSNTALGSWTDAGPLVFTGHAASSSPSGGAPSSNDSPKSDDPSGSTLLNQLINSPSPGIKSAASTIDPPDPPDPPAPTPEPRYSALALLGLGWAGLGAFRKFKTSRALQRES